MKNFLNLIKYSYIYLILFVIYVPLIIVVILSFNGVTEKGNINVNIGHNVGGSLTGSYEQLSEIADPLLNSIIIGIVTTPISVVIATLTCFGLWTSRKFYTSAALGVSNFSILSPDVITGLGLSILFIATFLPMGISLGMTTIILSHISFCVPYAIVTIFPRMEKINRNWILASYDLGCKKWKTFIKIVIPYLLPSIISAALIVFTMSFDDFIITNLVRGSTQTISTQLYLMRKGIKGWAVAFGAIILLIILFFVIIIVIHKRIVLWRRKINKYVRRQSKHRNGIKRWKNF